jgi:hypothetical protein
MTDTFALQDSSGAIVALVQVTPTDSGLDNQLGSLRGTSTDRIAKLGQIGDLVAATCKDVIETTRDRLTTLAPQEFEITFGVSISTEGGVPLLTKADAEATLEVRALWKASE